MSRGTVVLDELIMPIVDVRLLGDAFVIVAEVHGPVSAHHGDGLYTVHSPEGQLVVTGRARDLWWPTMFEGDTFRLTLTLDVEGRASSSYPVGLA